MFEFNLKPSYLEKYYSCDYLTEAEWIEEMQPNKIIGISFILLASAFLVVYIPVIIVLSQNEFLTKSSCYSILLYISIIDSCTITINGIIFGYLSIRGDNLCTSYNMVMFAGEGSLIGWYTSTSSVIILGINRLLEACNRTWANFFFEGKKVIFWLIASFCYGLFIGLFTPPMLFTGKHYAVFFNPFIDIEKVKLTYPEHYENWPHAYHNISICVILPVLYIAICTVFFCRFKNANSEAVQTSRTQNSLLIQSLFICTATFLAGSIYQYFQFFTATSQALILFAQYCWIISHGIGSFVLAFFNKAIRKNFLKYLFNKWARVCNTQPKITLVLPYQSNKRT